MPRARDATGSKKYLARGWRLKGRISIARLEFEEAEDALRKAMTFAERVGNPTQLWKTHLALERLYADTRRAEPARAASAAASRVIDGIGRSLRTEELKQASSRSPLFQSVREHSERG